MRKKILVLLVVLSVLTVLPRVSSFAQDLPWRSRQDCINNFDADKIDLNKELSREQAKEYNSLLKGYFICRALLRNDVSQCKYLLYGDSYEVCSRKFRQYKALIDLAKNGRFSSDLQALFPKITPDFVRAFNQGDENYCGTSRNCRAMIRLDERMADDNVTKNLITIMKAVKNSDAELCRSLNNDTEGQFLELAQVCRALISQDERLCMQCQGAQMAIQGYCNAMFSPAGKNTGSAAVQGKERGAK